MSVELVIAAVGRVLQTVPGADGVLIEPPQKAPAGRFFLVYARPAEAIPFTHTSRDGGGPTWKASDTVVVEWHRAIGPEVTPDVVSEAYRMLDRTRAALAGAFVRDRFGGSVLGLGSVTTTYLGPMEYAAAISFGFRCNLALTHTFEAEGGA